MDEISNNWVHYHLGLTAHLHNRIVASLFIVMVLWVLRTVALRAVWRKTEDARKRYRWRKGTVYAAATLGFLIIGRVWFVGIQSVATFLGIVAIGVAIALQDLVKSLAAWAFVLWRRPFSVGDRVQVGNYKGDVIDIRIFKFSLMEIGHWVDAEQSTGRAIHLPNTLILAEPTANSSHGFKFIWNEIPVLITCESSWERAKEILLEVAQRHAAHLSKAAEAKIKEASKQYMIFYSTLSPAVYTKVKDSGVLLTIRYLIDPRRRRDSEQEIWEDILKIFGQCNDIDFAYPTQRFFNNAVEGKDKGSDKTPTGG